MATLSATAQALVDKINSLIASLTDSQHAAYFAAALEKLGFGFTACDVNPAALGVAAPGTSLELSRADHVHAMPTAAQVGAAATSHAHAISDVTSLQTTLDAKLAQGKTSMWIPATAMTARTTNGAASGSVEATTNKVMKKTLDFDTATTEYAQFTVAMPKKWNEGTVTFQALWTSAGGSGGIAFGLQAVAFSDLDNLDVAFGTAQVVTDTLGTAGYLHQTAESAAITVAGSPADGDLVVFQVYRDVANGSDTLGQDALLLGIRLFYTTNLANDA